MTYLKFDEKIITDFSDANINSLYNQGYVFGRIEKGYVNQTRSLRIDLSKFELSSENRRVLRKTEDLKMTDYGLPTTDYHWSIGKLGKDFYDTKFGERTFTANKFKELLTDGKKSNFNLLLTYSLPPVGLPAESMGATEPNGGAGGREAGYTICYQNPDLLHYCYPFYNLQSYDPTALPPNLGLGMMLKAIALAKEQGKKYLYLGSFQRPSDTYKLQFEGLEWWDGKGWNINLVELKKI